MKERGGQVKERGGPACVGGVPEGERLPRQARITRGPEIRRVVRTGGRRRAGPVDLFVAPSTSSRPRVAVVVPRHGHTAVERNRLQRRLREIARRELLPRAFSSGEPEDLVLRARPSAYSRSYRHLREAILSAHRPGFARPPGENPCPDA